MSAKIEDIQDWLAKEAEYERTWAAQERAKQYQHGQRYVAERSEFHDRKAEMLEAAAALLWSQADALAAAQRENTSLRYLLWLRHGCSLAALYGDDSERQCGACGIDFQRQPVAEMAAVWLKASLRTLDAMPDEAAP